VSTTEEIVPEAPASLGRRLFSLAGLLPAPAFVVFYVWLFRAPRLFAVDPGAGPLGEAPWWLVLSQALLVVLPLLYHASYAIWLAFRERQALTARLRADVSEWLERIAQIFALLFMLYHLGTLWFALALGNLHQQELLPWLMGELSSTIHFGIPAVALFYLLGAAGIAAHSAHGMARFVLARAPGLLTAHKARIGGRVLGFLLFLAAADDILFLATGEGLIPSGLPGVAAGFYGGPG
jgi:hypothetical protein